MNYEYGIAHHSLDIRHGQVSSVHREGMTEDEVDQWLAEWEETSREGVFVKVCRPVGDWEVVE